MLKNKTLIKVLAASVLVGMSFTSCTHLTEKNKDRNDGDDDGYTNTNSESSPSKDSAVQLSYNTWETGQISGNQTETWFKFTANSNIQNIFITDHDYTLNVSVYDNTDKDVTSFTAESNRMVSNKPYISYLSGSTYFIKVSGYGPFKIGFTDSPAKPGNTITELNLNEWKSDEVEDPEEKWYKFSPIQDYYPEYVFVKPGTLSGFAISIYENCTLQGGTAVSYYGSEIRVGIAEVNYGNTAFIRLICIDETYEGTYQIAFTTENIPPESL